MADNPFASYGVPPPAESMQNLIDQAVVLNTALVPKLPEINIVDGMVPVINQVFADSGSNATFAPNTTINFNFGNHRGKLIDWTQSRICFNVRGLLTVEDIGNNPGNSNECAQYTSGKFRACYLGAKGVRLALRNAGMVFSQVTVGGAGRPLTINDYEMVAMSKHLLSTCESNVRSRIGEITTNTFPGCTKLLPDLPDYDSSETVSREIVIPVSMPVTNVLPVFQNVDNYLNSVTTGIELRLTVTSNNGVFSYIATEPLQASNSVAKKILGKIKIGNIQVQMNNNYFYKHYRSNPCEFCGIGTTTGNDGGEYIGVTASDLDKDNKQYHTHRMTFELKELTNVRIDMISTEHPDDNITAMLTNIAINRGLFYPHQMNILTPFNFVIHANSTSSTHYNVLVPVVSGKLRKLPIINLYTSLNGTYKTPIHQYRDEIDENMTECAHQFNRAFGTCNSTILSPLNEIMDSYLPTYSTCMVQNAKPEFLPDNAHNGERTDQAGYEKEVAKYEYDLSDSFITNSTVWELEKSAWMSGPDIADYANKYQIVFDIKPMYLEKDQPMTLWICQRCDCYTHIRNGYMQLLTSKKEVALALQQAQPVGA